MFRAKFMETLGPKSQIYLRRLTALSWEKSKSRLDPHTKKKRNHVCVCVCVLCLSCPCVCASLLFNPMRYMIATVGIKNQFPRGARDKSQDAKESQQPDARDASDSYPEALGPLLSGAFALRVLGFWGLQSLLTEQLFLDFRFLIYWYCLAVLGDTLNLDAQPWNPSPGPSTTAKTYALFDQGRK